MIEPAPCIVLFVDAQNDVRSIMAECALGRWGAGRFRGASAGTHPAAAIDPLTLALLERLNYSTIGLATKSWADFAAPAATPLDFVFTLCARAAAEPVPAFPGNPVIVHWGVEDPEAFTGPAAKREQWLKRIYLEVENRVKIFAALSRESLSAMALRARLEEIGRVALEEEGA
jgi:arsenate reductase